MIGRTVRNVERFVQRRLSGSSSIKELLSPVEPQVDRLTLLWAEEYLEHRYVGSQASLISLSYRLAVAMVVSTVFIAVCVAVTYVLKKTGIVDTVTLSALVPIIVTFVGGPTIWVLLSINNRVDAANKTLDREEKVFKERLNDAITYSTRVEELHKYFFRKYPAFRTLPCADKLDLLRLFYREEIAFAIYLGIKQRLKK